MDAIKENYEFLKSKGIEVHTIETCLHILSTNPNALKETYEYVLKNYGKESIYKLTSILKVPVQRIKEIEDIPLYKEGFGFQIGNVSSQV